MEQENREKIIRIEGDVSHIKKTTDKIEGAVSALLEKIANQSADITELRGRVRELEHEAINLRALVWKLFGLLVSGGGAIGAWELFGK